MFRGGHGLALGATLLVVGASACTMDVGTVRFSVPTTVHRFDTTSTLWVGGPSTLPEIACGTAADCCAPMGSIAVDCRRVDLGCGQARCSMAVSLESTLPVFLLRAVPDLALLSDSAMSRLRVHRVRARGRGPEDGAPTASLQLLVAPIDVGTAARATPLATVPALRLADGVEAEAEIADDTDGALRRALKLRSDPLNFIVAARVPIAAGGAVPKGALVAEIDVELETTLGP